MKCRAWSIASKTMFLPNSDNGWEIIGGKIIPLPNTVLDWYSEYSDRNGKEIFSGDIVKYCGRTGVIINSHEGFIFYSRNFKSLLFDIKSDDMGKIGNVHQNPELLDNNN